ncbi:MAG: purine-nucleoside phosphorylase [Chloroflexi bacterium]|nr:purine-nucleoside phosphorylase [Chloroflexota bacterium]MBK8932730.1 purine-nucleoside phosphorylase [Chloroflexota bacterium]
MSNNSEPSIQTAVNAIRRRTQYTPKIGLVLGSGLSDLANALQAADTIPYEEIPGWPASTVVGHSGKLVIGQLKGQTVLAQQGRAHFYEGYSPAQVVFPVRVMHALGIQTLIVTNAAGGINRAFSPGDLMLIKDHLNFVGIAGSNPLRGPNDDQIGPRFPDMTQAYDPGLRQMAKTTAVSQHLTLHEGVYAYVAGPSFETPAELRFLHAVGADAVGMSTVPEVIVARHAGMRVLGISSITNKAILDPTPEAVVSHEEVLETGKLIVPRLTQLLYGILAQL